MCRWSGGCRDLWRTPIDVQVNGSDEEGEHVSLFGSCWVDYLGDQDFLVLFEHGVDIVRYGGGGVAFGCFVVVGGVGFKFLLRFD